MEKTYGRLIDEVEKLDRKRRMYIGTKNGSGYFFIGTRDEFCPEYEFIYDRSVCSVYNKNTIPEEAGTVILISGSAVGGCFWFHDEYVAANNRLNPFSAIVEFRNRRYVFDETLSIGKFNRLYHEVRLDYFGTKFPLSTFSSSDIDRIGTSRLQGDNVFIPDEKQLGNFIEQGVGEKWTQKPAEVLEYLKVNANGLVADGRVVETGSSIELATRTKVMTGRRVVLKITESNANFKMIADSSCVHVPVFFSRQFMNARLRIDQQQF
jgi:hypothetical protein